MESSSKPKSMESGGRIMAGAQATLLTLNRIRMLKDGVVAVKAAADR